MLKGPFPICDLGRIYTELVGMLFTRDLLVEQSLAHAGAGDTETGHPVDGVDGQAEAIGLIADGEFQRRVDVTLLLVAAHVNIVLAWPTVGEAMVFGTLQSGRRASSQIIEDSSHGISVFFQLQLLADFR